MDISVIVCTYNQSKLLQRCLRSLEEMTVPQGVSWEVLVVDNNSVDNTKDTVKIIQSTAKINIRYIYEKQQGLSYARNKGVKESAGKIVVFIDDDSIADIAWLASIIKVFYKYDADCIGGKILPIEWPKKIPRWLTKELYPYVSIYDKGDELIEWKSTVATPHGSNVSYKKTIFQKVGLFDTTLGRVGKNSFLGGEEQELNQRVLKSGGKIFYQPKAIVYHPLYPKKLKKSYSRKLDFYSGLKSGLRFGEYNKKAACGIPLFIINQFLSSIIKYIKSVIKDGYAKSFRKELYCWYFLGFIWGRIKYRYGHQRNHLYL